MFAEQKEVQRLDFKEIKKRVSWGKKNQGSNQRSVNVVL